MTHTSESAHWYSRDGRAVYEVPSADGSRMIAPTLREARKHNLLPGFTAVAKILAAPGLEKWKRDQAVLAALTLTRDPNETDDQFLARVDTDGKAHARQRADEGTEIHKAIEQFLRGEAYDARWHEHVSNTVKLLYALGDSFVGDFKTKATVAGKRDTELFYDDHVMQLVAYKRGVARKMLELEYDGRKFDCETTFAHHLGYGGKVDVHSGMVDMGSACVSIIIPVDDPANIRHKIWTAEEQDRALDMFDHCLALWKAKSRYESGWTP